MTPKTLRSIGARLIAISAITGAAIAVSAPASAAPVPYPITKVSTTDENLIAFEIADGEQFALVTTGTGAYRMTLANGAMTPIKTGAPFGYSELSDDGHYAFRVEAGIGVQRVEVGTMVETVFDEVVPAGWTLQEFEASDAVGRLILVRATESTTNFTRSFLYDTQSRELRSPDGIFHSGSYLNSVGIDLAADGSSATIGVYATPGEPIDAMTWNLVSGARTVVAHPTEVSGLGSSWVFSGDLQWAAFGSGTTWFRRNLTTGATDSLPSLPSSPQSIRVHNGGRVVMSAIVSPFSHLYSWDGSGPLVLLTRNAAGNPAQNGASPQFGSNPDATKVWFDSFSPDLPASSGDLERELYRIDLAPAGTPNPAAIIQPSERYCTAAVGAEPGDFVGLNVTPISASGAGFGTLHSSDDPAGTTSNVNFGVNTIDPNVAFVKVGSDGQICYTNSSHATVHLIIDEMIVGDAAAFRNPTATGAQRLADTRSGLGGTIVAAGESRCLSVVGANPGEFVGVNALVVEATTPGFGTVHASGSPAGESSTVNYLPGSVDPNFAFTQVGPDGKICFTNAPFGAVHLVLDQLIVGTATALARPATTTGSDRPVDTRQNRPVARLTPNASACFSIPGADPGDFGGVNILAVGADGGGFATLHAADEPAGSTSNANFRPGSFDPNFGISRIATDGRICLTNSQHTNVDVIVDTQIIANADTFTSPTLNGATRLLDTRIART